jgi:hypothetical protein
MPPKKAARSSTLYVVTTAGGLIDSIHASQASAEARVSPAELEGMIDVDVKTFELVGGSINITEGLSAPVSSLGPLQGCAISYNQKTLRSIQSSFSNTFALPRTN